MSSSQDTNVCACKQSVYLFIYFWLALLDGLDWLSLTIEMRNSRDSDCLRVKRRFAQRVHSGATYRRDRDMDSMDNLKPVTERPKRQGCSSWWWFN